MTARRGRAFAAAIAVVGALAALAAALLWPAEGARPRTERRPLLVAGVERKLLPELAADTVVPPPARLDLATVRGQPVFIDVWASWCGSCEEEAPMLARLARAHRDQIRFVGIDVNDSRSAAGAFIRRHRLAYPHLFDPRAKLARKLGVYGIPTMIFVDRRGRIAATLVGKQPERKLRRYLALLARDASP